MASKKKTYRINTRIDLGKKVIHPIDPKTKQQNVCEIPGLDENEIKNLITCGAIEEVDPEALASAQAESDKQQAQAKDDASALAAAKKLTDKAEAALQSEVDAHEITKKRADEAEDALNSKQEELDHMIDDRDGFREALEKEKEAHAETEKKLTASQKSLATAKKKLAAKK